MSGVKNTCLVPTANGTFSGKLKNSVTGTYNLGTNGLLTLRASSGFEISGGKDALRLEFVTRLETDLNAGDFVFQVEDAPGTPDQTECLFH
jgi:hypothetical protein